MSATARPAAAASVAASAPGHPPAPWHLHGPSIVVPALVPVDRARAAIDADVEIVRVAPGFTLGALLAVTYEGSTLSYSELIASPGTVRSGARVGGWISHIWVDDEQSVSGGRSIWMLPKELATFAHERRAGGAQQFEASDGGVPLVRMAAAAPRLKPPAPLPALVPMISGSGDGVFFTLGRSGMSGGPARVRVEIPAESPLASLGLRPAPVALAGHASLTMPAPRRVG